MRAVESGHPISQMRRPADSEIVSGSAETPVEIVKSALKELPGQKA
jgi:hypothetical protein